VNKEQIKTLVKVIVPALLAMATAYGYADSACSFTCAAPVPTAAPEPPTTSE
jgi:hypothetical protein